MRAAVRSLRDRRRVPRRARLVAALCTTFLPLVLSVGRAAAAAPPAEEPAGLRIAVVPFEGEPADEPIGELLSVRFERLGVERLLAPGTFVAERAFDPRAELVRTWAHRAAVDTVVVGRVAAAEARPGAQQIEAVARSGHSGAELFRHAVHVPARAGLGSALDQLAAAIVRDLGGDPLTSVDVVPPPPPVSANAAQPAPAAAPEEGAKGDPATAPATPAKKKPSGLESRLSVDGFKSDAPIEIQADAAEIMAEGERRKLVFQGAVRVRQDNVSVRSERLEAEYAEGESEPERLVARGKVHVEQGNRSARCDRAEYVRATQKVTCRGHAELIQGCDVVRGELIELDLAGEKARVEGAASIVISPKQNADAACSTPARTADGR